MAHSKTGSDIPRWLSQGVTRYGWLAFLLPFVQSLAVKSLGVVYGDIGTSPLYAENVAFALLKHAPSPTEVIGIVSTIVWSLILVPFLWYNIILLRTTDRGEGGITALLALVMKKTVPFWIVIIGVIGISALFADGMITPAISVLSSIEGLRNIYPSIPTLVIVIVTIAILGMLFSVQHRGTGFMGLLFGPYVIVWFVSIGTLGVLAIFVDLRILQALNPWYAMQFIFSHPLIGGALDGIVLVITGGEALYADVGHFGKRPMRTSWTFFVMPALLLQYLGQGAMVLHDPTNAGNTFFATVPSFLYIPMILLSTGATIIASQAMITGVFSLVKALSSLGLSPRFVLRATSRVHHGQIYYSYANWALMVGSLTMVVIFQQSNKLANAYGLAVTVTMLTTIILKAAHSIYVTNWKRPVPFPTKVVIATIGYGGTIGVIIGMYFVANFAKIFQGGQLPAGMTFLFSALMFLSLQWERGKIGHKTSEPGARFDEVLLTLTQQTRSVLALIDLPIHAGTKDQIAESLLLPADSHKIAHVDCNSDEPTVLAELEQHGIHADEIVVLCSLSGDIVDAVEEYVDAELKQYQTVYVVLSKTIFKGRRLSGFDHQVGDSMRKLLEQKDGVVVVEVPHRTQYLPPQKGRNGNKVFAERTDLSRSGVME
jgi:K+ transporter